MSFWSLKGFHRPFRRKHLSSTNNYKGYWPCLYWTILRHSTKKVNMRLDWTLFPTRTSITLIRLPGLDQQIVSKRLINHKKGMRSRMTESFTSTPVWDKRLLQLDASITSCLRCLHYWRLYCNRLSRIRQEIRWNWLFSVHQSLAARVWWKLQAKSNRTYSIELIEPNTSSMFTKQTNPQPPKKRISETLLNRDISTPQVIRAERKHCFTPIENNMCSPFKCDLSPS